MTQARPNVLAEVPDEFLAHTICEGGDWIKGYAPNWSTGVLKDGRVFDRVYEKHTGKLFRETFDAAMLAHIDNVINGRWKGKVG